MDKLSLKGATLWAKWGKIFQTRILGGIVRELKQLVWMKEENEVDRKRASA
jgi:hypothetical protein